MTEFTREIKFIGAYCLRGDGKKKRDFGIHGMEIHFRVKGPKGGISITIFTKWYIPEQQQTSFDLYSKYPFDAAELCAPNIVDVSYHAKEPQYEGQTAVDGCLLTDGPCYSDGSSLWGNECWREGFLHGGSDWLFEKMELEYFHLFENGPKVDLTPVPRKHPDEDKIYG